MKAMKARFSCSMALCCVLSLIAAVQVVLADTPSQKPDQNTQASPRTAFTYQGQLRDANGPVNGTFDLQFVLYSAQTGGEGLGVSEMKDVALTNGMFRFKLDFGPAAVEAKESWLEIGVRPSSSAIWDLDNDPRVPDDRLRGQLHVLLLDNDWPDADDVYMKHYTQTINVDRTYTGEERGRPRQPFNTLGEPKNLAWDGARIRIKAGAYAETLTFSKRVEVVASGGTVTIGR